MSMLKGNELQKRLNDLGFETDGEDWDDQNKTKFKGEMTLGGFKDSDLQKGQKAQGTFDCIERGEE